MPRTMDKQLPRTRSAEALRKDPKIKWIDGRPYQVNLDGREELEPSIETLPGNTVAILRMRDDVIWRDGRPMIQWTEGITRHTDFLQWNRINQIVADYHRQKEGAGGMPEETIEFGQIDPKAKAKHGATIEQIRAIRSVLSKTESNIESIEAEIDATEKAATSAKIEARLEGKKETSANTNLAKLKARLEDERKIADGIRERLAGPIREERSLRRHLFGKRSKGLVESIEKLKSEIAEFEKKIEVARSEIVRLRADVPLYTRGAEVIDHECNHRIHFLPLRVAHDAKDPWHRTIDEILADDLCPIDRLALRKLQAEWMEGLAVQEKDDRGHVLREYLVRPRFVYIYMDAQTGAVLDHDIVETENEKGDLHLGQTISDRWATPVTRIEALSSRMGAPIGQDECRRIVELAMSFEGSEVSPIERGLL